MPEVAPVVSVSVSVLLPLPGAAMLVGENAAVTLFGRPVTDSATAELNPLLVAVVSVILAGLPTTTLALVGLGVSVKLLGATIVRLSGEVLVTPPPVAVIVRL